MTAKKIDILDVARAAKVSASTVSRSFNHPDLVKPATRRKIERAVRKLGYIRNRAAQTMHGRRSGTIGVIVPTVDHTIFAELIQSFSEKAEELGFSILLASHGYELQREYTLVRKMLEHRVDGIALIGAEHREETFALLKQQGTAALLLWNYARQTPFPCVGADNFQVGTEIGRHLAEGNHQRIAAIFPPLEGNDRARQRLEGLRDALSGHGTPLREDHMIRTNYSVGGGKSAVERMREAGIRPDAIVCGNDVLAWGAMHAFKRYGVDVPGDVAVIGIGDFKGSDAFEPALTTIRLPARRIGMRGAALMADYIADPLTPPDSEMIPAELMRRATTKS